MSRTLRVARVCALALGAVAVAWGCVIAAAAKEPAPLIIAGSLTIAIALVGNSWEEIALKVGDSEARVKRARLEATERAADEVEKSVRMAASNVVGSPGVDIDGVMSRAAERARAALTAPRHPDAEPSIKVGPADTHGRRRVRVTGVSDFADWTVDRVIRLETPDSDPRDLRGHDGTYLYPDDWGIAEPPAQATLSVWVQSIYGGEEGSVAKVTLAS